MGSFSSWILSIVGIILLGVLIDLILPEGQTNKYIKSIFSIIVIFVIVSPLVNLTKNEVNLDDIFKNEIEIDREYVENINDARLTALNNSIIAEAENVGLKSIEIEFVLNEDSFNLDIEKVNIYLKNLVIDKNFTHIDKYKILVGVVQKYLNIEKEYIFFYE